MKASAPDLRPIVAMLRKACAGQMTEADSTAAMALCVPFGDISFHLLCQALNDPPTVYTQKKDRTAAKRRTPNGKAWDAKTGRGSGALGLATAGQDMARGMALACANALEAGDLLRAMGAAMSACLTLRQSDPHALAHHENKAKGKGPETISGTGKKPVTIPAPLREEARKAGSRAAAIRVFKAGGVTGRPGINAAKELEESQGWPKDNRGRPETI